jgi:hypothetical protein
MFLHQDDDFVFVCFPLKIENRDKKNKEEEEILFGCQLSYQWFSIE